MQPDGVGGEIAAEVAQAAGADEIEAEAAQAEAQAQAEAADEVAEAEAEATGVDEVEDDSFLSSGAASVAAMASDAAAAAISKLPAKQRMALRWSTYIIITLL